MGRQRRILPDTHGFQQAHQAFPEGGVAQRRRRLALNQVLEGSSPSAPSIPGMSEAAPAPLKRGARVRVPPSHPLPSSPHGEVTRHHGIGPGCYPGRDGSALSCVGSSPTLTAINALRRSLFFLSSIME